MAPISFREATTIDIPHLAEIISTTEAWKLYNIDFQTAVGLFENMEDTIHIAEINNQIVGFITLRINGVGNIGAYIRMVAVAESHRGKGIGQELINFVAEKAFKKLPNLFLICSVDNHGALRFYEKVGFTRVGLLPDLVIKGHDEILYRKSAGTLK